MKHDRDLATAARFLTRALELKPGDPYALNSLAAISQELGDSEKALRCFDEAIASNPAFANAWFGKALLFSQQDQPARSVDANPIRRQPRIHSMKKTAINPFSRPPVLP